MKETSSEKFEDALSVGSEWDTDHAFVNYVMHPLTGMISYQSAERPIGIPGSRSYST